MHKRHILLRNAMLVAVCLLVTIAAFRIQTYISGQDPVTYMRLARSLLAEPVGSPEFREALTQFAPGYAMIVAVAIRVGGRFAPHWINLGFGLLLFLVVARFLDRLYQDAAKTSLFLVMMALFLFTGYAINPHFLLYPFRAMPGYLLIWTAFLLLLPARPARAAPLHVVTAAFAFLAATVIREPLIFAAAGAGLWLLLDLRSSEGKRNLVLFLAPFCIVALAGGLFLLLHEQVGTDQLARWLRNFALIMDRGAWAHFSWMSRQLALFTLDEVSWAGVLFLLLGLWKARRDRAAICFFVVPAILFFVFYCFYLYPHRRYYITILLFLSPLIALGFSGLLDTICTRIAVRQARAAAYAGVCLGFLALLSARVMRMEPWGERVSRQEVLTFYDNLHGVADPSDLLFIERPARMLWDVLLSYSRFRTDATLPELEAHLREGGRAFYFEPLNEAAFYPLWIDHWTPAKRAHLHHRFDLEPLPGQRLSIAGGEFQLHEIRPWSQTRLRQTIRNVVDRPVTVWIDLRSAGVGEPVRLGLDAGAGELWWSAVGGGIHALALPAASNTAHRLDFLAESETPLPANPVLSVVREGDPIDFHLMSDRLLSCHAWFQPTFRLRPRGAIALGRAGVFAPPQIHGDAAYLHTMFLLAPSPPTEHAARLSFEWNGEQMAGQDVDLSAELARFGFSVPVQPGATPTEVSIRVEPAEEQESHLRIRKIRFVVGR